MIPLRPIAPAALSLLFPRFSADAIILYRTGEPAQNTSPLVNDVAGSGG